MEKTYRVTLTPEERADLERMIRTGFSSTSAGCDSTELVEVSQSEKLYNPTAAQRHH